MNEPESERRRNIPLTTETPAKRTFHPRGEAVLTVAVDGALTIRIACGKSTVGIESRIRRARSIAVRRRGGAPAVDSSAVRDGSRSRTAAVLAVAAEQAAMPRRNSRRRSRQAQMRHGGRGSRRVRPIGRGLDTGMSREARHRRPKKARRRRELQGANPTSGCFADGRLRRSHPVSQPSNSHWPLGGSSLSLADALRRRPRRHLHRLDRNPACCILAPDVAGLTGVADWLEATRFEW